MGTTAEKLTYLNETKTAIKEAIVNKGVTVSDTDTFRSYADKIESIETGGTTINNQDKTITENGTYTADDGYTGLGTVTVDVETGITPAGSLSITSNGTYDVTNYASADVTVAATGGSADVAGITIDNMFSVDDDGVLSKGSGDLICTAADISSYAMYYAFYSCTGLTSISFPSLTTLSGGNAMQYAFQACAGLTSISFPNLTTISGTYAMQYAFQACAGLTSISFPNLTTISGSRAMYCAFYSCTGLTSISFPSLTTLSGGNAMYYAFQSCKGLTSVEFPALTSSSFGSSTNQFNNMLKGVTGCTVHFPSNLESVIGSWSDVTAGFGGTNTTVLYDLDATE